MACWYFATVCRVFVRESAFTSQSETTSTPAFCAKFSRSTPPYQPQPIMPSLGGGTEWPAKRRERVATAVPATANEEIKSRRFIIGEGARGNAGPGAGLAPFMVLKQIGRAHV